MNDITSQMLAAMQQYSDSVQSAVSTVIERVGKEAKQRVASESPKRTGSYKKGWRVTITQSYGKISCVISQKSPTYRLTHLLEYGHKTRSGTRTKAQPHIRQVEEWAEREVMKEIEKAVKG